MRARQLLSEIKNNSPALALERARFAIYGGDCDTASAVLSGPALNGDETAGLLSLSKSCARATAGSAVVEDRERGVWLRLQDEGDRALAPLIFSVVWQARAAVERDLGVELPRPLRIDLVRDLFSLSALTGLPLSAAETTGTVAVARWGRVTIISPRATPLGYPWEDTLAHEITHLALSRATRDKAPLWLQEGIAKREETRWRPPRPLDESPPADDVALTALANGRDIGIDRLGPSIAMLPTPEAASTAFAEVTSFVAFWIRENGDAALQLLLADLKGLGADDTDAALRSVTGYGLAAWAARWRQYLLGLPKPVVRGHGFSGKGVILPQDEARRTRLADLLWKRGHAQAATSELLPLTARSRDAGLRWRAARAVLQSGSLTEAAVQLGISSDLDVVHGAWWALSGRMLKERGAPERAEESFALGVAVDPYSVDVACEGHPAIAADAPLPADAERRALCLEARRLQRD